MKKATLQTVARDVRAIARSVAPLLKPANKPTLKVVAVGRPELAAGEKYGGIILEKNGEGDYYLVKLPGEMDAPAGWVAAGKYAAAIKGAKASLPTRRELALMFANIAEEFKTDLPYWSSEEYAGYSSYAWGQWFDSGGQINWGKDNRARACAVRRVPI